MRPGSRPLPAILDRNLRHGLLLGWVALLAFALSYSAPAYAQDVHSPNATFGSLRGTVINALTREPVPRALVYSPDNRLAMFTDAQGRFELKVPQTGSNTTSPLDGRSFDYRPSHLRARKPGFLENNGSTFFGPLAPAGDDITIALTPEALIVGRVNLPASNQSDRMTVELCKRQVQNGRSHWVSVASVRTRSNGEFRIAGLAAGAYKLFTHELLDRDPLTFDPEGQLYGYPPIYYPTAADFSSSDPIILEAGKILEAELAPVLQPYFPVKIAITNLQTEGQVQVSVAPQGHKGPGYSLGYDGAINGMLPNGTYTVEATLTGEQSATGTVNITVHGAPQTNATMTMISNGPIALNVKDNESAPGKPTAIIQQGGWSRKQRADVSLQASDDFSLTGMIMLRGPAKPNDNKLIFDNVPPGRYWVNINPFGGYVASAEAGGVDLLRHPLVVGTGGAIGPAINIVLRDDVSEIEGTIDGMPPPPSNAPNFRSGGLMVAYSGPSPTPEGPYVYCVPLPDSAGRFAEAWVLPEGNFQVQQLTPGVYRILAFDRKQQELEYQNPDAMRVYEGKGPVVRVSPGQTEHVRVTLISTVE